MFEGMHTEVKVHDFSAVWHMGAGGRWCLEVYMVLRPATTKKKKKKSGLGLLKLHSFISQLEKILVLSKFSPLNHSHSSFINYKWYSIGNQCFEHSEKLGKYWRGQIWFTVGVNSKISAQTLSCPLRSWSWTWASLRLQSQNWPLLWHTMTSSNGNIFHITGPLWGEFTGHRWIPLTKASDAELWCFLWSVPEQTIEQTIETLVTWDGITLIIMSL